MHSQSVPLQNRIFRPAVMEASRVFLARYTLRVIKGRRSISNVLIPDQDKEVVWGPFGLSKLIDSIFFLGRNNFPV